MRIVSGTTPGALRLAGRGQELSAQARRRLKWMDYYESHGHNACLTCRHFDISPQTFYRWRRRYDPRNLRTLEDRSHRPRRLRQPTWSPQLAEAVLSLRQEYPRWGKDKLVVLLRQEGWRASTSMVGRILRRLRERGVQVDTLDLRPPTRSGLQAVHRPRRGLPLGCPAGGQSGHRSDRYPLSGHPPGADALPHPRHPDRRGLRIPGHLRGSLPATGDPPLPAATPLP